MACMCGATDCPSCGPAQGYIVVRIWNSKRGHYEWVNVEEGDELEPDEPEEQVEDGR